MPSLLSHLSCGRCGADHPAERTASLCTKCGGPLLARYAMPQQGSFPARAVASRPPTLHRLRELSPIQRETVPSLGEGGGRLVRGEGLGVELDLPNLLVMDEGRQPTGSLYSRHAAVALARARELGIGRVGAAGPAALARAVASYASLHGLDAHLVVRGERTSLRHYRASIADSLPQGIYNVSPFGEPYGLEGLKTLGFEVLYNLRRLPNVVVLPVDGSGLGVALWKAWNELEDLGWIGSHRPRMFLVEHAKHAPIHKAWKKKHDEPDVPHRISSDVPSSMAVAQHPGGGLLLRILRVSEGLVEKVSQSAIEEASGLVRNHLGLAFGAAGCAALAAARQLRLERQIERDDIVLVVNPASPDQDVP
jgi:threonine synthase